jgi:enamine deaminase RidA (YjgF/YER057c/UK114 family)
LELPPPPRALAAYQPAVVCDGWVYTAGQLPLRDGALTATGLVGADVDVEEAAAAAAVAALNALAAIAAEVADLDRVQRVVKVTGFVASAPGFTDQPLVLNGASQLLADVLGDAGVHARSAVGVAALPLNAAVEVEVIARIAGGAGAGT